MKAEKNTTRPRAHYEAILKLNPRFAPAANNLAWILVEQGGNLDVALSHAQTAREQQPNDPHIADTLGWIYYKKNAYLLAVNLLKEAVEKLPNEPDVHFHYGMAQYKNGDTGGSEKVSSDGTETQPDLPWIRRSQEKRWQDVEKRKRSYGADRCKANKA